MDEQTDNQKLLKKKRKRKVATEARVKPHRPFSHVLQNLRQVTKINREVEGPVWYSGEAEHPHWGEWPLRLTIWNIFKGSGGEHFYNDLRLLCFQSDLVLLQEALLSQRSMKELSMDGFLGVHGASYERADRLRDGVMTLSRMHHDCDPVRIICKYPEPILRTPKAALVTQYKLQGMKHPLVVVNLHATLIRTIRRMEEELEHLIERLPYHEGPLIFAGDFNTFTPRYFQAVARKLEKLHLHYVTIPNDPRRPMDHLDQLFVRDIKVHAIHVDTRIRSSDHFPIRATVSFPAK